MGVGGDVFDRPDGERAIPEGEHAAVGGDEDLLRREAPAPGRSRLGLHHGSVPMERNQIAGPHHVVELQVFILLGVTRGMQARSLLGRPDRDPASDELVEDLPDRELSARNRPGAPKDGIARIQVDDAHPAREASHGPPGLALGPSGQHQQPSGPEPLRRLGVGGEMVTGRD